MVNKKDIKIPRLKFKEEHEKLVKLLKTGDKKALMKEAKIQHKEMIHELHPKLNVEEIKAEVKKKKGKKEVEVFEKQKNKKK
jgi:peptidyl-tRNA hydrolase